MNVDEVPGATSQVLYDVALERLRQDERWGEQNHPIRPPDSHTFEHYELSAHEWKRRNDSRAASGILTWDGILLEEVFEALSEDDPVKMRAEFVQVAAVAAAAIECIDRKMGSSDA